MGITYYNNQKTFKLDSQQSTYLIGIADEKYVGHMYYGAKIHDYDLKYMLGTDKSNYLPSKNQRDQVSFEDTFAWEYSCSGFGDFREHCIELADNSSIELIYSSHNIYNGKKKLPALPATFGSEEECQTLEIILMDERLSLQVTLIYTVFEKEDAITRSVIVRNVGEGKLTLKRVFSTCVDYKEGDYDFITLHGAWGRERGVYRRELGLGKQSVSSIRGVSSHQENPFMAILKKNATENYGEVYGYNFVYSGNFLAGVEKNQFSRVRAVMGIHPYQFEWKLLSGEEFVAPEVVMVFSNEGIGGMSRRYHDLYRRHLIRGKYKDKKRPILINNWEATYFNFNADKLISIAKKASELGIEMMVMDDGWFGKRNDDNTSLGDWFVNEEKLSCSLNHLVSQVNELGMKFGIWLEPEMVSPESELFKEHPDWVLHNKGVKGSLSRNQYVLDFSRKPVRDEIYNRIYNVLKSANIEYVKWDMNRSLTNVESKVTLTGKIFHEYMLGVYDLQNRLISDFPDILLENCSSGGGRFDAGMLHYSPQIWCSDDTDAIERLEIQRGTAIVYPLSTIGAHVSDCPNHATGRTVAFDTRGQVALAGTFGYELDVTNISKEEQDKIREQVKDYHSYNDLIREGDYFRIASVGDGFDYDCYMVVSKDKKQALVSFVRVMKHLSRLGQRIRLQGLDPEMEYTRLDKGEIYYGNTYMNVGIEVDGAENDFEGKIIVLTQQASPTPLREE